MDIHVHNATEQVVFKVTLNTDKTGFLSVFLCVVYFYLIIN